MSQSTDVYSSSLYESDSIDPLSYLPLDGLQLFTPDLSSSQQSLTLVPEAGFLTPLAIPSSLQRVGQGRRKPWILYSDMSKDDFLHWWLETQFGNAQSEKKKKIHWDGARHISDIWKHFDQVAHHVTGEPKVMCRKCGKIMDHPNHTLNGTNSLRRHCKGDFCQRATNKVAKQPDIKQLMRSAVSNIILLIEYIF
jgi:hypothetical protein